MPDDEGTEIAEHSLSYQRALKRPMKKKNRRSLIKKTDQNSLNGGKILEILKLLLKRCERAGAKIGYPGEGGERPFRHWLAVDLLEKVLQWPSDKVIVGERFDVLLQDAEEFPIATIETKAPYRKASKKERDDFEKRLSGFGTLRTAYFTNGVEWERLDIFARKGNLEIQEQIEFNLEKATHKEAEDFFAPITAQKHFLDSVRVSKHQVSSQNPHILDALASDLDQSISELSNFFEELFTGLRAEKAGKQAQSITLSLFDLWCDKSLIVSSKEATISLVRQLKEDPKKIDRVVLDLGFTGAKVLAVVDSLASLPKEKRSDPLVVSDSLWPLYEDACRKLFVQTSHVLLARSLLYRIGEDQNIFPRRLSGKELEKNLSPPPSRIVDSPLPAINLLSQIRRSMEEFLPIVYKLGEFDWWLITPEKRAALKSKERFWLREIDKHFDIILQRLMRKLNAYFLGRVDVDVWRNVYQKYLPEDERQRLGGFYTPDELINLILDLTEFEPEQIELCELSFIDPACGSGAFVTNALARLLKHIEIDLPCHAHLFERGLPKWKRAEKVLTIVEANLHAVDIHPFAAFLTTLNVLFLLMPLYVLARGKNPDFSLDLQIFASDSLEKHDEDLLEPDMFAKLNSRVQLSEESFHRYQKMLKFRFDRVFGNPPWGGVLKGPLAPVYNTGRKVRLSREYKAAARGKYDIYGLFVERAIQILKSGGRFGLLTQGTFIDKQWASGLRGLLSFNTKVRFIVDLNPFGQLFFHAMNTPCILVADVVSEVSSREKFVSILSESPKDFKGLSNDERRKLVISTVHSVIDKIKDGKKSATSSFARGAQLPIQRLREPAKDRWNLSSTKTIDSIGKEWFNAADILEPFQGVTVGGKGCLDLMLMSLGSAKHLRLEQEIVYRVIKGREIIKWKTPAIDHVILYPYVVINDQHQTGFYIDLPSVKDDGIREILIRSKISDSLDFDFQIDRQEKEIVLRKGINSSTVFDLLKHRSALGILKFPEAAKYLVSYYEILEGRIFKKRNIRTFNRKWYEFIWPRDPRVMLEKIKLITPRLTKEVRFALDTKGTIPQDSCICLVLTTKTMKSFDLLRKNLSNAFGQRISVKDVLKYCLAFLNSDYAQERLVTGHLPSPKGFYAITEEYLREIPIPPKPARENLAGIIDFVSKLMTTTNDKARSQIEKDLAKIVNSILKV